MKNRCGQPESKYYKRYGARGVKVCGDWKDDFVKFRDWALLNGYINNLTIDRKDNDGNYEPGNCQWITRRENTAKGNK